MKHREPQPASHLGKPAAASHQPAPLAVSQEAPGGVRPALQARIDGSPRMQQQRRALQVVTAQPAGPALVVQRAVGFEFETGWQVRRNTELQRSHPKTMSTAKGLAVGTGVGALGLATGGIGLAWAGALATLGGLGGLGHGAMQAPVPTPDRRLAKGERIKSGDGFTMEADDAGEHSAIEFVIQPPLSEEAGDGAVAAVMDRVRSLADKLNPRYAGGSFGLQVATNDPADAPFTIFPAYGPLAANPQVTAGLRLDRITSLAQNSHTDGTVPKRLMSMDGGQGMNLRGYNDLAIQAVQLEANQADFPGNHGSNDLVGLVTLLISYIAEGADIADPDGSASLPYVKHLAILMARTDFATLLRKLPKPEQDHFLHHPDRWVAMIMGGAVRLVGRDWDQAEQGRVVDRKIRDPDSGDIEDSPVTVTRDAWLRGLLTGTDLMSAAHFSRFTSQGTRVRASLEGMGRLGNKLDTVGTGKTAPREAGIFEFRKVETNLPLRAWKQFAIDAYKYIRALNRNRNR